MSTSTKPRPRIPTPNPLADGDGRQDQDPATGRFVKGNKAAVGRSRPFAKRRAEMARLMMNVPDKTVQAVIDKTVECALKGQPWACKYLLTYWAGPAVSPTTNPNYDDDRLVDFVEAIEAISDDDTTSIHDVSDEELLAYLSHRGMS